MVKWTARAVLILTLLVVFLYGAGSYRRASDHTQLSLVRLTLILSLLLVISSIYGLLINLFYAIRRQRAAFLAGVFGYIILIILGAVIAFGAAFIIGAVRGNY
ncbi:MAG: hypothetical protein LBH07_02975 [Treponema sp.]|nr:hypothetical protein [Treponema sp.]